jgi:hypothetical protein
VIRPIFKWRALDERDCLQRLGIADGTVLDNILALINQLIR